MIFGATLDNTRCKFFSCFSSSETQGQLAGATGSSRAKVYNKNGRAPGHLLSPDGFHKSLKSRLPIGQKNFSGQSASGISSASGTRSVRVNVQGLSRSCCKLSPVKIPLPQLAAPGSLRMALSSPANANFFTFHGLPIPSCRLPQRLQRQQFRSIFVLLVVSLLCRTERSSSTFS